MWFPDLPHGAWFTDLPYKTWFPDLYRTWFPDLYRSGTSPAVHRKQFSDLYGSWLSDQDILLVLAYTAPTACAAAAAAAIAGRVATAAAGATKGCDVVCAARVEGVDATAAVSDVGHAGAGPTAVLAVLPKGRPPHLRHHLLDDRGFLEAFVVVDGVGIGKVGHLRLLKVAQVCQHMHQFAEGDGGGVLALGVLAVALQQVHEHLGVVLLQGLHLHPVYNLLPTLCKPTTTTPSA
jgi:hypothetical protein